MAGTVMADTMAERMNTWSTVANIVQRNELRLFEYEQSEIDTVDTATFCSLGFGYDVT